MTPAIRHICRCLAAVFCTLAAVPAAATAQGADFLTWNIDLRAAYMLGYTAGHNDAVITVITAQPVAEAAVRDAADAAINQFPCAYERDPVQVAMAVSLWIENRPARHHERLNRLIGEALRDWCEPISTSR